ncbi:hypothetical protein HJC23_013561 [Cyclotella cryptica]|uniref:Sulfotransferase n=1 Tax=Cyclotella cryptica TaxID=29204 RepID=A0ABD3PC91_9STRA
MKYFSFSRHQRRPVAFASLLALAVYQYLNPISNFDIHQAVRRKMTQRKQEATSTGYTIYSAVGVPTVCSPNSHLRCIQETPERSDTILFWHIPKSGGTTAKRLYQCMGKKIAAKTHQFAISPSQTINVDTTILPGILQAREMGLVPSRAADMVVTHEVTAAVRYLFNPLNRGRALALFRHPIDRLVSKFYYLQIASWERGYRPHWKNMSLLQWAETEKNGPETNYLVQKLSGKEWEDPVTEADLPTAKQVLRDHVVVGLMDEMQESFRRFNIVMSATTDQGSERNLQERCMKELFHPEELGGMEKVVKNQNEHQTIAPGSHEWLVLARKNYLDMHIYSYIEMLFKEQKDIIDSYQVTEESFIS